MKKAKKEMCFAIKQNGSCDALTVNSCPGYDACSFYKSVWKCRRDQKMINAKLCTLPLEQQQEIAEKYYDGKMPWKGAHE